MIPAAAYQSPRQTRDVNMHSFDRGLQIYLKAFLLRGTILRGGM